MRAPASSAALDALGDLRLRRSTAADRAALIRLAQLDGAPPSAGEHLLAEEAGELRAALPLAGGPPMADPFHATADLVAMLELRVAPLPPAEQASDRGRGLRARLERRSPAPAHGPARRPSGLLARPVSRPG